MKILPKFPALLALILLTNARAAEHPIQPGESPQAALDNAAPGDRLIFLPGLHQHSLGKHQSIFYVDKPIEIELREVATLKLADNSTKREPEGEITTDQDSGKKLDDLEIGGAHDLSAPAIEGLEIYGSNIHSIQIDGEGKDGSADSFQ